MTDTKTTPLRARMIEDMRIKGLGESSQKAYIRAVRYFAEFLGRSPDTGKRPVSPLFCDVVSCAKSLRR